MAKVAFHEIAERTRSLSAEMGVEVEQGGGNGGLQAK